VSERVFVAMSGGVDSALAAALLVERGLDVVGVWMRLTPAGTTSDAPRCCGTDAAGEDARRAAAHLGIPFYAFDYAELFGRIAPIPNRGYVEQFARSFDITGGEVVLNGPMKSHRVDIQAQYKPSADTEDSEDDTVIKLEVQGTVEKMSIVLSSDPVMSEAEIVSYIATGHSPTVDRGKSSGSTTSDSRALATDIGLSQIAGFAEEPAREAIGLDVLQVRFDALKGATLVAGRYLDPQLYVGFRQPLQYKDTSSPSTGEANRTSVEVEYAVH